jgi:hypothetical protein
VGELFDDEDGGEEGRAGAAVLVGDLDTHDSELEEGGDELFGHGRIAVHVVDERADLFNREVAHALLEHLLVFGQDGQRRAGSEFDGGGHGWGLRWGLDFGRE